jgi:hypothetical protein
MDGIGLDSLERRQRVPVNYKFTLPQCQTGSESGFFLFFSPVLRRERETELE